MADGSVRPTNQTTMVGFCSTPLFADHRTGPHHPERPDRIRAIHRAVREAGMLDSPDPFPEFKIDLGLKRSNDVKLVELPLPDPIDVKWLQTIHSPAYVQRIEHICQIGGGVLDQGDTPVCPESYEIARLSAGAVLGCCDAVIAGPHKRAFAAVRPPGHHAEPDRPMGFCLFANVALGAKYLQQHHGVGRIAIVDFDVHHGNGTQGCFESDPSVLFISLHQDPRTCYPGSGNEWEIGIGAGRGYTLNLPFAPGSDDADYLRVFDARVIPELDDFRPEILMISAGFDAHREDLLAQMSLSEECFELMTRELADVANQHCGGRIVSALEGGYNLRALGRSVVRHLRGLNHSTIE